MERKNTLLLTVIAVATLLVAVVGATFAFFTAQGGNAVSTGITVTTHTTDSATFTAGDGISFALNQTNFGESLAAQPENYPTDSSTGTATFTASDAADADLCYNVTVEVTNNTFKYTANNPDEVAELELTVTKTPHGASQITLIDGMDITTTTSNIQVPNAAGGSDYKHTLHAEAGKTSTDNFVVTVTAINLDADQQELADTNARFEGSIRYTKVAC